MLRLQSVRWNSGNRNASCCGIDMIVQSEQQVTTKFNFFFVEYCVIHTCTVNTLYVNPTKPSGHYMYHQFNIQQFYVLPTQCICAFCVDLTTNSDYFPIQH